MLLFKCTIYEIKFDKKCEYSQSQISLLFDLPSQEDLVNWGKIIILVIPLLCFLDFLVCTITSGIVLAACEKLSE